MTGRAISIDTIDLWQPQISGCIVSGRANLRVGERSLCRHIAMGLRPSDLREIREKFSAAISKPLIPWALPKGIRTLLQP